MYEGLTNILKSSATDNNVRVVLLTGTGDYYCSGNDLSNFLNIPPEGPEKLAADSAQLLKYTSFHSSLYPSIHLSIYLFIHYPSIHPLSQRFCVIIHSISKASGLSSQWTSCWYISYYTVSI